MTSLSCSLESSPRVGVKTFIGAEWGGGGGGGEWEWDTDSGEEWGPGIKHNIPSFLSKLPNSEYISTKEQLRNHYEGPYRDYKHRNGQFADIFMASFLFICQTDRSSLSIEKSLDFEHVPSHKVMNVNNLSV